MTAHRRYYLNALFDLELGGFPTMAVRQSAAEMTALFVPLLCRGDTAIVDVDLPASYLDYLRGFGLALGNVDGTGGAAGRAVVWGWNSKVAEKMAPVLPGEHPPIAVVRKVNGRHFCSTVAPRFGLGVPGSRFCGSMDEVDETLYAAGRVFPVVIKPAFGGSGYGLRVLRTIGQMDRERQVIGRFCLHGGAVAEPWLTRKYDLSSSVEIFRDGGCGPVTFQRQWVNGYGAFFGVYCADDDPVIGRWKERLEQATGLMAAEAAKEGYFGPAGFDSFVYEDSDGSECLAAVIEINARHTMGMVAQHLRTLIAPGLSVVLRFISRRRCVLPETVSGWLSGCGDAAYNPVTKKGILILTPLRTGFMGRWEQPQRSAFLIAGSSEDEIAAYDRELRLRFSR